MGLYLYRALTQDGREISGSLDYSEEREVLAYLESQGYIPVNIAPGESGAEDRRYPAGASARELRKFSIIDFTQGLGMLLRAGLRRSDGPGLPLREWCLRGWRGLRLLSPRLH